MLPEYRYILHPTDMGTHAGHVLRHVFATTRAHGARLKLLHVIEPISPATLNVVNAMIPSDSPRLEELRRQGVHMLQQQLHEQLETFYRQELPEEASASIDLLIAEGSPAAAILQTAKAQNADLIAMGTHGHSALGDIMLGSVAHKVLHRATIPVLLVPFRGDPAS